jgi:peptidoglycan/xylan/chitin deacetylase (PgdA/CDA1 family)
VASGWFLPCICNCNTYQGSQNVTATLVANGAKGTFFFNGNNCGFSPWPNRSLLISAHPGDCIYAPANVKAIKQAYSQGHQIASHTWAHKNLSTLTFDELHSEFWRVEQALERIIGVTPAFARPPYGDYTNLVRQVAAERGQKLVLWDLDDGDTTGLTPAQSEQLYKTAAAKHPSNILSLMHEVKGQ